MATCEKCAALERENEALKKKNGELEAILYDKRFKELSITTEFTSGLLRGMGVLTQKEATKHASPNDLLKLSEAHLAANDRLFAQHQALLELPLKLEQMKAKTDNLAARTDLTATDKRLKEENIKDKRAGRLLKERQARFLEAATLVLERYAETGNMVEADFEVIDQLKQIVYKIPAKISGNSKKL